MFRSPNKIQEVEADGNAVSGSGVADGHRCRSSRCCGDGGPSGLNVNNNIIDNDNVGVAVALSAEILLLPRWDLKLSGGRT